MKMRVVKSLITSIILALIFVPYSAKADHAYISWVNNIDILWPQDKTTLCGMQLFKALVPGWSLDQYIMYWQVDTNQWTTNKMSNSFNGLPHKEAQVFVDNWSGSGFGSHTINFIVTDLSGTNIILLQKHIDVFICSVYSAVPEITISPQYTQSAIPSAVLEPTPYSEITPQIQEPSPELPVVEPSEEIILPTYSFIPPAQTPISIILPEYNETLIPENIQANNIAQSNEPSVTFQELFIILLIVISSTVTIMMITLNYKIKQQESINQPEE